MPRARRVPAALLLVVAALGGVPPLALAAQAAPAPTYRPRAHHEVLDYFRRLWAGKPRDAVFEAKTLDHDLGFRVLNLAELIVAMCAEIDLPVDRAVDFVSIGTGPAPLPEGVLTRKVATLGALSEEERARRLLADPQTRSVALAPMAPPLDRVNPLLRYCMAVEKWCRKDRPPRFPALVEAGAPDAPPHMAGRHAEDVRAYRERRQALGRPWEERALGAVSRHVQFEIQRWKRGRLPASLTPATDLRTDLGLDELDVVEMLLGLEDHYDGKVRFADEFSPSTVGDIAGEIERQLPSRR